MLKKDYSTKKAVCKVTFTLPAEAMTKEGEIRVLGDFNNWNWNDAATLTKVDDVYQTVVELTAGQQYEFRYLIDQQYWFNDTLADDYVASPYYGISNCVVKVDAIKEEVKVTKKATTAKKKATPKKKATKKTKKDNLKKIEGIGPKIEKLLKARGIETFQALADAKLAVLKDVLTEAGSRFKMHDPTTWPEQAALAAAGKWDALEKLQDELDGGKRK